VKKFSPPTKEEVQAYLNLKGETRFDGELFVAHYQAQDWKRNGGQKIKDWKSAVTTWRKNEDKRSGKNNFKRSSANDEFCKMAEEGKCDWTPTFLKYKKQAQDAGLYDLIINS